MTMLRPEIARFCLERAREWRGPVGVLLSGGLDSLGLLTMLHCQQVEVTALTYKVEGYPSVDCARAQCVTANWGVRHEIVEIPLGTALKDVLYLMRLGFRGQVVLQCLHGHLHIARWLSGQDRHMWLLFNGSGVDGLYEVYVSQAFLGWSGEDPAKSKRMCQAHLDDPNDDAMQDQAELYHRLAGAFVVYPYRACPGFVAALMGMNYKEKNHPGRKGVWRRELPELRPFQIQRTSQQLGAGTKWLHEKELLHNPEVNTKGRKRLMEVYGDIWACAPRGFSAEC